MNARTAALFTLAMAAATPAYAADVVAELSQQTGLSERQVEMIIGNRTPFAEYRQSYSRTLKQFKAAVGEEHYQRLISGQSSLPLDTRATARVATTRQADAKKVL